jgi:hypothetical protein
VLDFLYTVIKTKTFKAIVALIAAALTAWATGCAAFVAAAEHPSVRVIACKVAVLEPYLGDAAAEVARAIDGDRAFDPVGFLRSQGLSSAEVVAVAKAYLDCSPDARPEPAEETPAGYQTL